ncbi:MAG: hypothetical protein HY550_10695 [Elusimicrobia bacterium]|nr:hypothetical protein [Elusimicrobiota bacterium]
MDFFRLRVINTFLLFLIGLVLGFILKDKFYPAAPPPGREAYQPSYKPSAVAPPPAQAEAEEPADEPYTPPETEPEPSPGRERRAAREEEAPPPEREAVVIEASPAAEEGRAAGRRAVKGKQDDFFSNPAAFEGEELEMDLQMITARKSQRGWRVNLVYISPEKRTDYLYLDDAERLGEKPDLRVGYVYRVRFLSGKGDASAGNTLLSISATGEKAAWATGISAVE